MGVGEPVLEIALLDDEPLERARRAERIEDRRRSLVLDLDARREQLLPVVVREEQNRLGDVPHLGLDEAWLVVLDERDDVPPGDVAPVADDEAGRVEVESN
jgi:hypothetical protein